jgi:SAM-dependent methyltransferase
MTVEELYASLYDLRVPDWPGEVDFYRGLLSAPLAKAHGVLEVACGTGRIARQLASEGLQVTGLDISPELLQVAREKGAGIPNLRWVLGDMRNFELGEQFGLVLIPGHSFQFMITPGDQVSCLERIKSHLTPDGLLVIHLDHQDFGWLGDIYRHKQPRNEQGSVVEHPITGQHFRSAQSWVLEPSTQTATVRTRWEELDDNGNVIRTLDMKPLRLHCVFRSEMEHLLRRVGFTIEAVNGDFFKNGLEDNSGQMIWLARHQEG